MENLVPPVYFPIVKCSVMLKDIYLEGYEDKPDIAVCTSTGNLLEFSNKSVTGSCDINVKNAESINIFVRYFPPCLYYIVKALDMVKVVAKEDKLELQKTFENVLRFNISDFNGFGTPQFGIWHKDDMGSKKPSIITDFSEENPVSYPSANHEFYNACSGMLQELILKVKEQGHRLKEKEQYRVKLCHLASGTQLSEKLEIKDDMVCVVGNSSAHADIVQCAAEHLIVTETWQRIHHNKLVICIGVCNNSDRCINEIKLILKCGKQPLIYKSATVTYEDMMVETSAGKRLKLNKSSNPLSEWVNITELNGHRRAVVTGILPLPEFIHKNVFEVTGTIQYSVNKSVYQRPLRKMILKVEDVVSGTLTPFSSESTGVEVLCGLAVSEHITLSVTQTSSDLESVLIKDLGFQEKFKSVLWNNGQKKNGLSGVMILIKNNDPESYKLYIYARDPPQVFYLVHSLYSVVTANTIIQLVLTTERVKPNNFWETFHTEVDYVVKNMSKWRNESNSSTILLTRDIYSTFRDKLSIMEKATDLSYKMMLQAAAHQAFLKQ